MNRKKTLYSVLFSLILFYGCDTNPPYVEIVYPLNLQEMDGIDVIIVDAYDEGKVVEVQFFIDGDSLWTDYNKPWEFVWNVAYWADDDYHELSAKAIDYSGNIGEVYPEDIINVKVPSSVQVSPYLLSPALTDTIRDTNKPLFSWFSIPSAVSYEIEIAKFVNYSEFVDIYDIIVDCHILVDCGNCEDEDCNTCEDEDCVIYEIDYSQVDEIEDMVNFDIVSTINVPNDTSLVIEYPLTDSTAGFFWHVRGENDAGNFSDWSHTWIFNITGPKGPYPNYPALDTLRSKPAFSWYNNQYLASKYILVMGGIDPLENENYDGLGYFDEIAFIDTIIKGNDVYQEYIPDEEIEIESGKHWWKMKSMNEVGIWGEWSLVKFFYIAGPIHPTLSIPANGEIITGTNLPNFDWNDSESSVEYQFIIDNDEDFTSPEVDLLITDSFFNLSGLSQEDSLNAGTSYWKIRAKNDVGLWGEWSDPWNFTIAGPFQPDLVYPTTNKFLTDRDELWFNWTSVENGYIYHIQVDENIDFSSPEIDTTLEDTHFIYDGLLNTGRNYWRIRSKNNIELWGDWSLENSFRFYIYPETPMLTAPASGTVFTNQPEFYWVDLPGVTQFKLQISSNLDFDSTSIIIEEYPLNTGYSTAEYIDTTGSDFFWRLLSRNIADTTYLESDWSEIRYFIGEASPSPTLINPEFGEVLIDQPNFAWSSVSDGDNYQILVSSDQSFESTIDINRVISGTALTSDVALSSGDNYWKVRTQNYLGIWSDYSEIGMFIVGGPLPVSLLSPVNSSTLFSQPSFNWIPMSGAVEYQLMVDDSIAFNSPELDTIFNFVGITSTAPLKEGSNYWKVRGKSDLDIWGGFTDAWQFTLTGPDGPILHTPTSDSVYSVYTTLTPFYSWESLEAAVQYHIEIGTDQYFSEIEYSDSTINTPNTTITMELSEGFHYWHIRGINELGMWGTWSETEEFKITGPPGPELINPNGQPIVDNATPVFSWESQLSAVEYRIQIADNIDFLELLLDEFEVETTFTPEIAIVDTTTDPIFWRVFSKNTFDLWGTPSVVNSFSITGPASPFSNGSGSYEPGNYEKIRHTNLPQLSWADLDNGENYQIQVSNIDDFQSPYGFLENILINIIIEENTYQSEIELPQGFIYWNIRTQNIDQIWGNWYALVQNFELTGTIPPELSSPIGESLSIQPTFEWEYLDTIPVQKFEIQVDNNPLNEFDEFPSPELTNELDGLTTNYTSEDSLKSGENFWRMRSMNEVGYWGEWSNVESFIMVGPYPPDLLLPAEGDTVRHLPEFSWNTVDEAVGYQLQVNDNFDFLTDSAEISIVLPELVYTSVSEDSLLSGQNYWRVRSRNIIGIWGEWSASDNFILAGPLPPTLIAPGINDTLRTQPTFSWNTSEFAINYNIQVDDSPDFSSPELFFETISNSHISTDTLSEGVNYWRVQAQNNAGIWGDWSIANDFILTGPEAPDLVLPAYGDPIIMGEWVDGETFNYDINNLELSWEAADNFSINYKLQISHTPIFSDTLYIDTESAPTNYIIDNILQGGNNYWRVSAENNVGIWGNWSNIFSFWVPYSIQGEIELIAIPDTGNFLYGPPADESEESTPYFEMSKFPITNEQYVNYLNKAYFDSLITENGSEVRGPCNVIPGFWRYYDLNGESNVENIGKIYFNEESNVFELENEEFFNHPVVFISWCGAKAFAIHHNLDLPSELEWEKAARGDDGRPWHWGEFGVLDSVNHFTNIFNSFDPWDCLGCSGGTTPIGFYDGMNTLLEGYPYYGSTVFNSPSPYGIFDLCGNIGEWTLGVGEGANSFIYRSGLGFNGTKEEIKAFVRAEDEYFKTNDFIGIRVVKRE